ncbi:MAG: alpha/beta fold hydrolase [Bryobacteraceae bacterium]|nr:alpha/beta fold hydrolase [Bryobacteraceae bacterium]
MSAGQIRQVEEQGVRGFLHVPDSAAPLGGLVLAHGAGASCNAPLLRSVASAFCEANWAALRIDLPFRQARAKGPPRRGDAERDRKGIEQAADYLKARTDGPVVVGGHSYGGRQSSMLVSEKPDLSAGLLLLAYPLHAPGRADLPRTAHLPGIAVPVLFVHGTRDPFGSIEELQAALALIPARTRLLVIDGAGHDLGGKWNKADLARFFAL